MNKIITLLAFFPLIFLIGCTDPDLDDHHHHDPVNSTNKVLMLKLDYNTFNVLGYKEFQFDQQTDSFSIQLNYEPASDFGYIQLIYKEMNQLLFYGTTVWDGLGHIIFPETMSSPDDLLSVETDDVIFPVNGFKNILPFTYPRVPTLNVWLNIQHLEIVRNYLNTNPNQKVQILFYRPSQGYGDPETWSFFILLKN